jgi:hypothetical protein
LLGLWLLLWLLLLLLLLRGESFLIKLTRFAC